MPKTTTATGHFSTTNTVYSRWDVVYKLYDPVIYSSDLHLPLPPQLSATLKAFITRFLFIFFPFLCFLSSVCHVRSSCQSLVSRLASSHLRLRLLSFPYNVHYCVHQSISDKDDDEEEIHLNSRHNTNGDEIPGHKNRVEKESFPLQHLLNKKAFFFFLFRCSTMKKRREVYVPMSDTRGTL